jgi:hypothetical protein
MRFSGAMPKSDSHAKLFFLLPTHKDDEKRCHSYTGRPFVLTAV